MFQIRIVDGVCRYIDSDGDDGPVYLDASVDHPLYTEAVDTALSLCEPEHGTPLHIKLVLEWDLDAKEKSVNHFTMVVSRTQHDNNYRHFWYAQNHNRRRGTD